MRYLLNNVNSERSGTLFDYYGGILFNYYLQIIKITNGMAYKMGQLPTNGYKEWDGNIYFNEKKVCSDIGKDLGPTIPYHRKTED